jgi:4-diphosphocytidyl-2-C-methyl-D-erythritol kinase
MNAVRIKAFAKINLGLRILGKRDDGYHEIETLFQSIDLHDTLTFELQEKPGIELNVHSPWLLSEKENLVYRAAELIVSRVELLQGVRITVKKRIPIGAGLGGGSSDAAATLVGLNKLFQLKLSNTELHALALELGSDVPYFLVGGLCRGRGRGELLERLEPRWEGCTFLLVKPGCSLSTEAVYREYDQRVEQDGRPMSSQIFDGIDCANDLEEAAARLCPELPECRRILVELKPDLFGMSGSGPTYYAGWRSEQRTELWAEQLVQKGLIVYCTHPTETGCELAKETQAH